MSFLQYIIQAEGKHSAVPQRSLSDIFRCLLLVRFLFKHFHRADIFRCFRNDIAIFFAGIRRFHTHQHQVGRTLCRTLLQPLQSFEIILFHVRIHRTYDHRLFSCHSLHILQICHRQCNRREGVSSAGLHADTDIFSQLVVDGRDLCLGCGNRDLCLRIRLPDLPVYSLHHGLQAAVFRMEYFDKLLGTDPVGQGPQPLSGTAR